MLTVIERDREPIQRMKPSSVLLAPAECPLNPGSRSTANGGVQK